MNQMTLKEITDLFWVKFPARDANNHDPSKDHTYWIKRGQNDLLQQIEDFFFKLELFEIGVIDRKTRDENTQTNISSNRYKTRQPSSENSP